MNGTNLTEEKYFYIGVTADKLQEARQIINEAPSTSLRTFTKDYMGDLEQNIRSLQQQVRTLTQLISNTGDMRLIVQMELALQSIKESPREEQTP
ncbi:MAG: hypothetical protein K0Q81_678 [Paenibacillus sp.]|jgi:hypothetical protein|nr:hypothetical protein [Paenibacillus sp.]